MAMNHFLPQIWNAQILTDFREQSIAAALVNREYEGDATKGNTVKITSAVNIQVHDYKAAGRTTSPDAVADTGMDLLIDQEKSFDFYVDDIDRAQVAGSMDAYTRSAAEGLAEDADKFIWAMAAAGALPANVSTSAGVTSSAAAWNLLRDLRKKLNKLKVPASQRVAVVNAEFEGLLLSEDSKITSVDTSGVPDGLREAILGRILGLTVVMSENLPTIDKPQVIVFYRPAVAFVSQVDETEALRGNDKFADRLRGMHVYGGKVVRPKGVAVWTAA